MNGVFFFGQESQVGSSWICDSYSYAFTLELACPHWQPGINDFIGPEVIFLAKRYARNI